MRWDYVVRDVAAEWQATPHVFSTIHTVRREFPILLAMDALFTNFFSCSLRRLRCIKRIPWQNGCPCDVSRTWHLNLCKVESTWAFVSVSMRNFLWTLLTGLRLSFLKTRQNLKAFATVVGMKSLSGRCETYSCMGPEQNSAEVRTNGAGHGIL